MHSAIQIRFDSKRGCGWRKSGGLYLVGGEADSLACGKFPFALDLPCQCCGQGYVGMITKKDGTPSFVLPRSPRRVNPSTMFGESDCGKYACSKCLTRSTLGYLLGVGEGNYPTKESYVEEALRLGFSKRIHAIPKGLVVGETPIFLAHRNGVVRSTPPSSESVALDTVGMLEVEVGHEPGRVYYAPAIFAAFVPKAIEYIVSDETDEEIEALVKRGITPVMVVKNELKQAPLEEASDVSED